MLNGAKLASLYASLYPPRVASSHFSQTMFPIREITTYSSRGWTIQARVTAKAPIRSFTSTARAGSVFSVDLLDKDGGEIRASFFNKAADKFYPLIDQGKVYTFSKGNVKVANKKYNSTKHNYELTFEEDAVIECSPDAENGIESMKFHFSRVRDLQSKPLPCTVDLLGVVKDVKQLGKVAAKGEELIRRTITIVDQSECAVEVTLWQENSTKFEESTLIGKVLALKGLSVREYNGSRSCSTTQTSHLEIEPASAKEEVQGLAEWYRNHQESQFFSISSSGGRGSVGGSSAQLKEVTVGEMKDECNRGLLGNGVNFEITGYLSYVLTRIKDQESPIYYMACNTCNRKLPEDKRCIACDKQVEGLPRFMLRAQFLDATDEAFLSVFHDQAVPLLGKPVSDFFAGNVQEELRGCYWKQPWTVRVRAVNSEYKGEVKPKVTVVGCEIVNYAEHAKKMIKKLQSKLGIAPAAVAPSPSVLNNMENVDNINIRKRKLDLVDSSEGDMPEMATV